MTDRRRVSLPVVGRGTGEAGSRGSPSVPEAEAPSGARAGEGMAPDPGLMAQGWEHRFVAAGERAEEMVALYRELGFEVLADPVGGEGLDDGCTACFAGQVRYSAIYTRRRPPAGEPHTTDEG